MEQGPIPPDASRTMVDGISTMFVAPSVWGVLKKTTVDPISCWWSTSQLMASQSKSFKFTTESDQIPLYNL